MPWLRGSFLCAIFCATLALASVVPEAQAQAPIENTPIPMWVPDAYISDVVRVGNTLVVGGGFNYVGPPTGPFAIADAADATSFNTAARLLGAVRKILADGSGGWFVISDSTGGRSAPSVVRIAPDGTRDPHFVPPANLYFVSSIAVDGARVFVAGTFTVPGNPQAQSGLVALDTVTGALLPWTPALLPTGFGGLVASQGVLYVGYPAGGSQTPSSLALDAATGAVLPFAVTGSVVSALGDRVHVRTSSSSSATITAYDRSGVPVPAFATSYPTIGAVAASPTHVYAIVQPTGTGTSPTQIVALDATTGTAVWSSPTFDYSNGGPVDLAREGSTLFVGGSFSRVGGAARTHVAAFDATTGALLPWAPSVGGQVVTTLAVAAGRVAIGGNFGSVGGIVKRGLVSLDLTTGRPSAVQPPDSNPVTALAATGDLVVAATYIYPLPAAPEVFAYSAATGARYSKALPINGQVTSMGIGGTTLFLGGFFNHVDTALRRNLAAYDLVAGQLLPWNPSPDDGVHALKVHAGALYAVGKFRSLPGYGRGGAVAFDLGSLQVTSWNPPHGGLVVYDVDAWHDRVFIGVHVRDDNSGLRPFRVMRTLAVDRVSGAPLNLDLPIGPEVAQVAGTLLVGGNGDFGGTQHPLAAFDATTGQGIPWAPSVVSHFFSSGAELPQNSKLFGFDGYLVLTGSLSVGTLPVSNLAVFKPQIVLPGAPRQIQMTVTGSTVSLGWSPGASPAPIGYVIEAGTAPGLADLGRFPVGLATQVAAGVAPGSYALRVRAIGASGEGPPSSEWLFTTPSTSTPPAAPSGLVGSVAGNVVSLGWTAAAGNATAYVVEAGTAPGLANLGVLSLGSLDTAIAGAVPGGTYYFRMRAANAFGSSAPSNEIVLVVP